MKIEESSLNGWKTLWVKEKLLVTSNFSFSHSVFKRLVSQGRQKVSLSGNGLIFQLEEETGRKEYIERQNFRLLQTDSICRRHTKCDSKIEICLSLGRKHCGKRRKC